jgi:glycosyltransferase involved in cell wall biosynthesis
MRIAQIAPCWVRTPPAGYGGTEAVVSALTEQLVTLGCDVTLCATGDSITQAKLWSWFDTPQVGYHLEDEIIHVVKAYEHIREGDFDIVHNHTYHMGPALLSLSKIPSITTYHGAYNPADTAFQAAFSHTHQYVSLSRRQRELLPQLNWIGTVYNAVNPSDFPFSAEKDEYLLFVGALLPWKGVHVAIQVAKELRYRLKIVGPVQQQALATTYYEQEIAPQVDGHFIEYLGDVSFAQKVLLYQQAKALLVPLLWEEPFGMIMIEAMACGTPVIAFARGAAPEIVAHGQVGFLVNDVHEMVLAVERLKYLSPLACREHVERHFNHQLMTQRYLEIYRKVIDTSHAIELTTCNVDEGRK